MSYIKKIRLLNFKKFDKFEVDFDPKLNLLIGDNEAGKSTILTAIDLAISGSRNKVETYPPHQVRHPICLGSFFKILW
jgi:putative ATP-dependent endonuclease of the OLD family